MKTRHTIACLIALTLSSSLTATLAAHDDGDRIKPPAVPFLIEAPEGFKPFLIGHAIGTQNYICVSTAAGPKWLFIGPQATVFNEDGGQFLTHFQSTNPIVGAIQATWQSSRDSSAVWAQKQFGSTDSAYVSPDAIEWLLLEVTGMAEGLTGGDKLIPTKYIQRVNTVGGKEPLMACTATILNQRQLVPYEADYVFYKQAVRHGR